MMMQQPFQQSFQQPAFGQPQLNNQFNPMAFAPMMNQVPQPFAQQQFPQQQQFQQAPPAQQQFVPQQPQFQQPQGLHQQQVPQQQQFVQHQAPQQQFQQAPPAQQTQGQQFVPQQPQFQHQQQVPQQQFVQQQVPQQQTPALTQLGDLGGLLSYVQANQQVSAPAANVQTTASVAVAAAPVVEPIHKLPPMITFGEQGSIYCLGHPSPFVGASGTPYESVLAYVHSWKKLGPEEQVWAQNCRKVLFQGVCYKFCQSEELFQTIINSGDAFFVQTGPDRLMGTGFGPEELAFHSVAEWGQNLHGQVLNEVRGLLRQHGKLTWALGAGHGESSLKREVVATANTTTASEGVTTVSIPVVAEISSQEKLMSLLDDTPTITPVVAPAETIVVAPETTPVEEIAAIAPVVTPAETVVVAPETVTPVIIAAETHAQITPTETTPSDSGLI